VCLDLVATGPRWRSSARGERAAAFLSAAGGAARDTKEITKLRHRFRLPLHFGP
jgi:hypothetical protein